MTVTCVPVSEMNDAFKGTWQLLAAGLLGFLTAIFAEPLRQMMFRPKLKLEFEVDEDFQTPTPEHVMHHDVPIGTHSAKYFRIKLINLKPQLAKACRAYLVRIDKRNADGVFIPTRYCDSIPLAWSCRQPTEYDPIDLPTGVVQFVDVISVRETSPDFKIHTRIDVARYEDIWRDEGIFRFTVQVSGDNVRPVFKTIEFTWDHHWGHEQAR